MTSCPDPDYIVVGAGAAGATLAARLAASHRVLLLEAGGPARHLGLHVPGLAFTALANAGLNWGFRTEPAPELDNRVQVFLAGKVVGGSSAMNGMAYSRGHSEEYDLWAKMGCEGWAFQDVLPYFKRSERNLRGTNAWHSDAGKLPLRQSRPLVPIYALFLAAAERMGVSTVDNLCENVTEGFGFYDVNIQNGLRQSTATAYLKPMRSVETLEIKTGALVTRLLFEGTRATGVEAIIGGSRQTFRAGKEIILCAGGIRSPQLLMLSGIGPADELGRLGIQAIVHSPRVGKNLQNHPTYMMPLTVNKPVTAYRYLQPLGAVRALFQYAWRREGVLGESAFGVGGFLKSNPLLNLADMQIFVSSAMVDRPSKPNPRFWDMLPKRHGFTIGIYQGTPHSRGEVTLRSTDPCENPRIRSGYFTDARDMAVLKKGVRRLQEVCAEPELASLIDRDRSPQLALADDAALEAHIRANVATSHHQSGTCAMGSAPDAVVDPRLRVRGISGLRIADASVIPLLPNAGLHAVTIMIGEKAADMILADA